MGIVKLAVSIRVETVTSFLGQENPTVCINDDGNENFCWAFAQNYLDRNGTRSKRDRSIRRDRERDKGSKSLNSNPLKCLSMCSAD